MPLNRYIEVAFLVACLEALERGPFFPLDAWLFLVVKVKAILVLFTRPFFMLADGQGMMRRRRRLNRLGDAPNSFDVGHRKPRLRQAAIATGRSRPLPAS